MPGSGPLSADGPLRPHERVAFLLGNALRNRRPYDDIDADLEIGEFRSDSGAVAAVLADATPSPSRALSDLFWMHAPWPSMERVLGPLRVADIGCGSGSYGPRLARWSGGRVVRYHGIDATTHPNWPAVSASAPFASFQAGDAEDIDRLLPPETNVIVSQSAIEHVADDARCFDAIHRYAHTRRLLQIHLVPSQACLWLYLWHGFRQYTPRSLSAITRRFTDCSWRVVVRLGGEACNTLHRRFITWPALLRRSRGRDRRADAPDAYRAAVRASIVADMRRAQTSPAFYALVVGSNLPELRPPLAPWYGVHAASPPAG